MAGSALLLAALAVCPSNGSAADLTAIAPAAPPALELPDLSADRRSLDDFADKVVLINFWASWCAPCIEEMPVLGRLVEAMQDEPFAVIAVNVGEGRRRVGAVVQRLGIGFPVLLDSDNSAYRAWGGDVLPTAYIVDRSGRLRYVGRGPIEWDRADIAGLLRDLAREPAGSRSGCEGKKDLHGAGVIPSELPGRKVRAGTATQRKNPAERRG